MNSNVTSSVASPFTVTVTVTVPPPSTEPITPADAAPVNVSVTAPVAPAATASIQPATPLAAPVTTPAATLPVTAPATQANTPAARPPVTPPVTALWAKWKKWLIPAVVVVALVVIALVAWKMLRPKGPGDSFVSGNGRIEATEIDVAARSGGRIKEILVKEGDFVKAGQVLARIDSDSINAQLHQAEAQTQQAQNAVATARSQLTQRESEKAATQAVVVQREAELAAARSRSARSSTLVEEGAASRQEADDDVTRVRSAEATIAAARAQLSAAEAAIATGRAQVLGAQSATEAVTATVERIRVDIADNELKAPRDGRIQFRVAQPGEVVGAGGRVLNMVDLGDVYITFFLPSAVAGRVALGSDIRLVLDAAPQYVLPAQVSFVADVAQFTPKTVETASEREKLMFRVKAKIDRELLQKHLRQVKTGLPGVAWVKLDSKAQWPEKLTLRVPE